jgi:hypothetical protein
MSQETHQEEDNDGLGDNLTYVEHAPVRQRRSSGGWPNSRLCRRLCTGKEAPGAPPQETVPSAERGAHSPDRRCMADRSRGGTASFRTNSAREMRHWQADASNG